ncbi:UNKNOWN [Stylonychia lemnae]|uniref:Uncharacterized protein n=1 Tax=Stylonychia lemnae TaxID=5949 RepID=A0A078AIX4_STYLE|nr:UNKNOWN [Stylonychia lemnae]|eukprot:CDW81402.1 UNKNOWN [Stylonychia lemnae]
MVDIQSYIKDQNSRDCKSPVLAEEFRRVNSGILTADNSANLTPNPKTRLSFIQRRLLRNQQQCLSDLALDKPKQDQDKIFGFEKSEQVAGVGLSDTKHLQLLNQKRKISLNTVSNEWPEISALSLQEQEDIKFFGILSSKDTTSKYLLTRENTGVKNII